MVLSVTVDKRFFTPAGRAVLNALLPAHLHHREDDDDITTWDEVWDRLDWGKIAQALDQAGYQQYEIC